MRTIIHLSFVLLGTQLVGCHHTPSETLEGHIFDSGLSIYPDKQLVGHRFVSRNPLPTPLVIRSLRTSCSCTGSTVDKNHLAPNEEFSVSMKVRLPNTYASSSVSCELITDPPLKVEQATFSVKYRTVPKVGLSTDIVDFGTIASDATATNSSVDLIFAHGKTIPPATVASLDVPEELSVQLAPYDPNGQTQLSSGVLTRRHRYAVKLTARAFELTGSQTRTIAFHFAADNPLYVKVRWTIKGKYNVSPSSVHYGFIDAVDHEYTKRLIVRYNDITSPRIDTIRCPELDVTSSVFTSKIMRQSDTVDIITLSLKFLTKPKRNFLQGTIELSANASARDRILVPWSAFQRAANP